MEYMLQLDVCGSSFDGGSPGRGGTSESHGTRGKGKEGGEGGKGWGESMCFVGKNIVTHSGEKRNSLFHNQIT